MTLLPQTTLFSDKTVISGHRRPGMNKKDRSLAQSNDLAVLTSVQEELRNCSKALSTTSPSSSTIKDACATLAQARRSMTRLGVAQQKPLNSNTSYRADQQYRLTSYELIRCSSQVGPK